MDENEIRAAVEAFGERAFGVDSWLTSPEDSYRQHMADVFDVAPEDVEVVYDADAGRLTARLPSADRVEISIEAVPVER